MAAALLLPRRMPSQASPFLPSSSTSTLRWKTQGTIVASSGREPRRPAAPPQEVKNRSSSAAGILKNAPFLPQEDADYLWTLGVGSVAGAAAIKYGCALLPEITRPNLAQALLMIGFPVLISVFLLVKGSVSGEVE